MTASAQSTAWLAEALSQRNGSEETRLAMRRNHAPRVRSPSARPHGDVEVIFDGVMAPGRITLYPCGHAFTMYWRWRVDGEQSPSSLGGRTA
jgi:hypothetical protein